MKEMKELNHKDFVPHAVKIHVAAKTRDYQEVADKAKMKDDEFHSIIDVYNNTDIRRLPDKIGITICYPNKENPTHMTVGIYSITITEKEFDKEVKRLIKELKKKIPKDK